jgi:hypothetical protein
MSKLFTKKIICEATFGDNNSFKFNKYYQFKQKNQFKPSDRHDIIKGFGKDLMIAFASANIPVYKLENRILNKTLSKYLVDEVATA